MDPRADRKLEFHAQSYNETVTGPLREVFLGLVAALGLVLLIVCANVANLLIARCWAVSMNLPCARRSAPDKAVSWLRWS